MPPRQAATIAREKAVDAKRRDAARQRQQHQEMRTAAKAAQAALLAHERQVRQKRAAARKDQAAAAAKTAAKAKMFQEAMRESREAHERLAREAREQRRASIINKNADWSNQKAFKGKLLQARQQEEKMLREERNAFFEAKRTMKEQQELSDKQERQSRAEARMGDRVELVGEFRRLKQVRRRLGRVDVGMVRRQQEQEAIERRSIGSSGLGILRGWSASSSEDSFLAECTGHGGGSTGSSIGFGIPGNWSVRNSVDSFRAQCLERARRPWV